MGNLLGKTSIIARLHPGQLLRDRGTARKTARA
jgi:hypothetical protein